MGYCINYEKGGEKIIICERKSKHHRWVWVIAAMILLFSLLQDTAREKLREIIIPGYDLQTVQAFDAMVDNIRGGEDASDAVAAFCREVLSIE